MCNGASQIFDLEADLLPRMTALLEQYADLPMDLADASLVILAEHLGHGRILSTDQRDFGIYRWKNTHPFPIPSPIKSVKDWRLSRGLLGETEFNHKSSFSLSPCLTSYHCFNVCYFRLTKPQWVS